MNAICENWDNKKAVDWIINVFCNKINEDKPVWSDILDECYNFEQLSDNRLYSCSVLGKLSIVYSHLLGSRFNLSSPRVPLVSGIVLEVWEWSSAVNKLSSSYRTLLITTGLYT